MDSSAASGSNDDVIEDHQLINNCRNTFNALKGAKQALT